VNEEAFEAAILAFKTSKRSSSGGSEATKKGKKNYSLLALNAAD